MTDLRKAAQMALDWRDKNSELLFELGGWDFIFEINDWSQSIRGALAQPEPEPVAWMHDSHVGFNVPLYTTPPQREWQGLTDEEGDAILDTLPFGYSPAQFYLAIEAKLKEKNIG